MTDNAYPFAVGELECIALRDCAESAPVRELILDVDDPVVADAFARRGWPTGDTTYDFLALFVRSGRDAIVIDAGWGPCTTELESRFAENLRAAGVAPDEVTFVILTHLDLDHAGGILGPHGRLAFPNARHVVAEDAWVGYTSEKLQAAMTPADAASFRTLASLLQGRVLLTRGETEILPGVRTLPAPGHRLGHMAVELVSHGATLLHLADTVLHPILVEHPDWRTGYDSVQETIRATRRSLFARAATCHALVFFSHAPFPGLGYIREEGSTWRWEPLAETTPASRGKRP